MTSKKRKKPRSWWINIYPAAPATRRAEFLHQSKKQARQRLQPNGKTIHVREVL